MSRDTERGTRGIYEVIASSLYMIFPTLIEMGLVFGYLFIKYDIEYVGLILLILLLYVFLQ